MKLNSAQLEAFFAVAKISNFTKAAETLHVTQSALSQRIAKLEEELETTLFIRDRNSIRLTEAGQKVLRFCQVSDTAESDLLNELKDSQVGFGGTLRIAGFSSVTRSLLIPALKKLMQKNEKLSLQIFTRELYELEDLLKSAEVDYILTNKKSQASDIENVFLGYEFNALVKSKKHTASEIYLDHDESDPTTASYFSQNKLSAKPLKMRYLDDVYGLIDGVKNGFGQAILPEHLIESEKDLEIIEPKKKLIVPVFLQFYRQPYYKRIHETLLADMQSHFQERLPQHK